MFDILHGRYREMKIKLNFVSCMLLFFKAGRYKRTWWKKGKYSSLRFKLSVATLWFSIAVEYLRFATFSTGKAKNAGNELHFWHAASLGGGELLVVEILVAFSTFNIRDATNDNQYSGDAAVLRASESVSGKEPVPKKPMREIWISGWAGEEMWSRKRRLHNISEEWYREARAEFSLNSS